MDEFKKTETTETKKPEAENFKNIKPESDTTAKDTMSFWDRIFGEKAEQGEGNSTTDGERKKRLPVEGSLGNWEGIPGDSKFIFDGKSETSKAAKEKLAEYAMNGVEFKNGEPDFSPFAEAQVEVKNMTENRYDYYDANGERQLGNYSQADIKCAEQWSSEGKDGKTDWTAREVKDWRTENKCSWHECCDTKTMQLVPTAIHGNTPHEGGVSECKNA